MPTRPSSSGGCHRGPGVCLGAVGADRRSGRSGKEVTSTPGRGEEAATVASSEHMRKGRGLEQASHAVFAK